MTGGAGRLPTPLSYRGLEELGAEPHVMVDGAARPGSRLVLSHWPSTPTPPALWRDLSAEIALAYLESADRYETDVGLVTLDHLDEDGLAALFVTTDPLTAQAIAGPLVAFARAGDFGVADERAARAVFAFEQLTRAETSPFSGEERGGASFETFATRRLLELFVGLVTDPSQYEWAWREADAELARSMATLRRGDAEVREVAEAALAVLDVRGDGVSERHRVSRKARVPLHPFAIHSATEMPRVLVHWQGRAVYYDRYETWVRYVSRRLPRRVDLAPLSSRLNELEGGAARWSADPPGAIVPALTLADRAETSLDLETLSGLVVEHLALARPAWDPFAPAGPLPG